MDTIRHIGRSDPGRKAPPAIPAPRDVTMKRVPDSHDALLVVDMQNDFLPGGSLGIEGADSIIEVVNSYIERFARTASAIFASRDYHPPDHISFSARGGPWPPHCVAGTHGAEFHPALRLPPGARIISKATSPDKDAYSALEDTPLLEQLRAEGIDRVFICGLAMDYCVLASGRDLLQAGFEVVVLTDAVGAVDLRPGDGMRAREELRQLGAIEITYNDSAQ